MMERKHPVWTEILDASDGDVRRLDYVTRYSSIPATEHENTSAHSFWVTLYAGMIQQSVAPGDYRTMSAVLLGACLHDVQDCVSGDVVRPFKYSSDFFKEQVQAAERKMVERLHPELRGMVQLAEMMAMGSGSEYVESVIKAADFMSLFHYMRREAMRGNLEVWPFFQRMMADLQTQANVMNNKWIRPESDEYEVCLHGLYAAMVSDAKKVAKICFPNGIEIVSKHQVTK